MTLRQLAPLFGISKSAADRVIDHLGPLLALPRKRFRKDTVLIVDGTLVPTRDHTIAEQSKNYRYSTAYQVVIDTDSRLVVVVGRPLPGNRHDSRGWEESGVKAAVGKTMTIADGGYQGTGLVIPHRRPKGEELEHRLQQELRDMDGAPESFVEFENRHAKVWRVQWHGVWYMAEWDTQDAAPQEIGIDELLEFAAARLRD